MELESNVLPRGNVMPPGNVMAPLFRRLSLTIFRASLTSCTSPTGGLSTDGLTPVEVVSGTRFVVVVLPVDLVVVLPVDVEVVWSDDVAVVWRVPAVDVVGGPTGPGL